MNPAERAGRPGRPWRALVLLGAALVGCNAAPPGPGQAAPVQLLQPAPFVQLALPRAAYELSQLPGLADLRVVDARGERVPHAWLPAAPEPAADDERPAALYPLPPRPVAGGEAALPLEVLVQAGRVTVRQRGSGGSGVKGGSVRPPVPGSPGWLLDLGERAAPQGQGATPVPRALRLQWRAGSAFSAHADLDSSDDLRHWRPIGGGPVLSLAGPAGPLEQRELPLPADTGRFVRLMWREPAAAPVVDGALALVPRAVDAARRDTTTELRLGAQPPPAGGAEATEPGAAGALQFDLGAALPVVAIRLLPPPGTRVLPVRLQGRSRADQPWAELGSTVFYRLQREGTVSESPALPVRATLRQVRVLPDPRGPALDASGSALLVSAQLATLVFAAQGQPPFSVLTGAPSAGPGALPIGSLVPDLDAERARLGRAELGAFSPQADALQAQQTAARLAALRPWLLWAVLLAGVAALALMVWRLLRARPAA